MATQQQYSEPGNYPEGVQPKATFTPSVTDPETQTQMGMTSDEGRMDPYAVKTRAGGRGIYGPELRYAAGAQKRSTGEYTSTAERVPSQVFAKELNLKTPSGKPFTYPVTTEGANPRQTRQAPEYDRMSDETLRNVASQSSGPAAQKLGNEIQRRDVARKSVAASDRILEINRDNKNNPARARALVNEFLNDLREQQ